MASYYGGFGGDTYTGSTGNDTINGNNGNDSLNASGGNDTIHGGNGNDTERGGTGDDQLYGDAGNDKLYGEAGNDTLYDGSGTDSMYGGDGDDTLYESSGTNTAWGDAGNDTFYGGSDGDTNYGGTDNDALYGGDGNDALTGNSGQDFLYGGGGKDGLQGGQGNDVAYGGAGNDTIMGDGQWLAISTYASGPGGTATNLTVINSADGPISLYYINSSGVVSLTATIQPGQTYVLPTTTDQNYVLKDSDGYFLEVIQGSANQTVNYGAEGLSDTLDGGDGDDVIYGQLGDDRLSGGVGNDTLHGGSGNDSIDGGMGKDSITGDAGADTISGGSGDDVICGGLGDDVIGGWSTDDSGNDTMFGEDGNDSIIGGAGDDTVYGGDGADTLSGQNGSDTIYGGDGADTFVVTEDHNGDTIFGGEGGTDLDSLSLGTWQSPDGVSVTFTGAESGTYAYVSQPGSGTFSEIESVNGTDHTDNFNASAATSGVSIAGNGGNDTLAGGSGGDTFSGGDGNDRLFSNGGNDTIYGGTGDDTLGGGAGNDTLLFGEGHDTVYGGLGDDIIDDMAGGIATGNNVIDAGAGNDSIWGGGGNDSIAGGADNDYIDGETGNDTLSGGTGNDTISGGSGNDTLTGGGGTDTLYGGSGYDTVQLTADTTPAMAGDHVTIVEDFDMGDADLDGRTNDQIDVSGLVDAQGQPVNFADVVVTDDGSGNAVLTFPMGEILVLKGIAPAQVNTAPLMNRLGVPCFTAGTMILTPGGEVPVERLGPGDIVMTRDNGPKQVLWTAMRHLGPADLAARPDMLPILIAPGGWAGPRGLLVSPQHGILTRTGARGGTETLIRATQLARLQGGKVRIARGQRSVTYVHLMFDAHQVLFSNGIQTESFYPGKMGLAALQLAAQLELVSLFPELPLLGADAAYGPTARPVGRFRDLPDTLQEIRPVLWR